MMQKKKKFKALVVDFDNTLVGRDFVVSERVGRAIGEIRERRVMFSIATGRPYYGIIRKVCKNLRLQAPQIGYGGAEIYDPTSDDVLWGEYLKKNVVEDLFAYFAKRRLIFEVHKRDTVYYSDYGKLRPFDQLLKFTSIDKLEIRDVPKIVVPTKEGGLSEEVTDGLVELLMDRYKDLHVIKFKTPTNFGLDITSGKASKHIAVLELSKLLKISPKEIVGVGDSYNDYPLLTACGVKVAMGDAPRELKQIADFIAPPQEEEGLVKVIKKYFAEV